MILKVFKKLATMLNRNRSDYDGRYDYYDYDRYDFGDEKDIREARKLFKELNND